MALAQFGAVRVLTTDTLGDTLLEKLEARLASETKRSATHRLTKAPTLGRPDDLATALRAVLRDILGSSTRLVTLDRRDPLVDRTVLDLVERVPPIVHARRDRLSEENIQVLVDSYLKTEPTVRARHAIEHDNARERARFIEDVECLTSRDLAELAGHTAGNSSATAARWKKLGRVFSIPWRGADLFPAFQFEEGKPRSAMASILAALPKMSPWQTAFWFTSSNSWLDGSVPAERLGDGDGVIQAARYESEALVG